jgi:hypothetical protein
MKKEFGETPDNIRIRLFPQFFSFNFNSIGDHFEKARTEEYDPI